MWFAEQLNSFLNLGECKEYPIMARSKSIPGSKTIRTTTDTDKGKEQTVTGNSVSSSEVQAVGKETPPQELRQGSTLSPARAIASESNVTKEIKAEPRKLEVVKSEPRKNVVPINLEDEIRQRAFELYQQRGSGAGSQAEDWLAAEREVRLRYRQQSA
jgi:hypothetical protein